MRLLLTISYKLRLWAQQWPKLESIDPRKLVLKNQCSRADYTMQHNSWSPYSEKFENIAYRLLLSFKFMFFVWESGQNWSMTIYGLGHCCADSLNSSVSMVFVCVGLSAIAYVHKMSNLKFINQFVARRWKRREKFFKCLCNGLKRI